MEKTGALVVGVVALVSALALLGGAVYAMGAQGESAGKTSSSVQGQAIGGGMMGGGAWGGMMGWFQGMMGSGPVQGCSQYMQH